MRAHRVGAAVVGLGLAVVACSGSATSTSCDVRYDCSASQTCWTTNGTTYGCAPAGTLKAGETCIAALGKPECASGLGCLAMGDPEEGTCAYWCDSSHPCPAGTGTCTPATTAAGATVQFCASTPSGSGGACGGTGTVCHDYEDCCSLACSGVCVEAASASPMCAGAGVKCTSPGDCCNGSCSDDLCVAPGCSPEGAPCGSSDTCCNADCNGSTCGGSGATCAAPGAACTTYGDCCSLSCAKGKCAYGGVADGGLDAAGD
jgi:hypothetical protein